MAAETFAAGAKSSTRRIIGKDMGKRSEKRKPHLFLFIQQSRKVSENTLALPDQQEASQGQVWQAITMLHSSALIYRVSTRGAFILNHFSPVRQFHLPLQ